MIQTGGEAYNPETLTTKNLSEVFFSTIDFWLRRSCRHLPGHHHSSPSSPKTHTPYGLSATLSRVFAVRDAFLYEGKELFNRAEFEFAAGVNFLNMALEFAFGGVGVRA